MNGTEERLLTPEEVAQRMQVPVSWVWRAARDGRLPKIQLGRHVRFAPEVVEEFIRNGGTGDDS